MIHIIERLFKTTPSSQLPKIMSFIKNSFLKYLKSKEYHNGETPSFLRGKKSSLNQQRRLITGKGRNKENRRSRKGGRRKKNSVNHIGIVIVKIEAAKPRKIEKKPRKQPGRREPLECVSLGGF